MFDSILVVCVGNICRSPTGERLLQKYLPGKKITSAGIAALVGKRADASAEEIARKNNISLENHKARQLTRDICHENDLILVMEKNHVDLVCKIAPESRGKVMLFGHWIDQKEVSDPYRKSHEAFEFVFKILDEASRGWSLAFKND